MEKLNIEYIRIEADLLYDMDDAEFVSWLECDDCTNDDYSNLIEILENKEMYERIIMTKDYLQLLGQ